jgi:epoxyqueuosine reductase
MNENAQSIKNILYDLGADLCGIADADRFKNAPTGFKPNDIYKQCRSVVVFAKRLPPDTLFASNCIPYTHVNNLITREVDNLTLHASLKLTDRGIGNVMIPSDDPYEYWDIARQHGQAILSLRHAGYLAGLGVLGKNTLLINNKYGNMIQIGAILIDKEVEPDSIADYTVCPPNCSLCLDSCPEGALDGITVTQTLCRPASNFISPKGYKLKKCYLCRSVCPSSLGT